MGSRFYSYMSNSARFIRTSIIVSIITTATLVYGTVPVMSADVLPPTTNLILSGVKGNEDWYITSVDANLRAFDLESSPATISHQLNSNPPQVDDFTTVDNAIINPSFEDGWIAGINNWQPYPSPDPNLYQASVSKLDYRSAAIQNSGFNYHYWTNYDNFVPVVSGRSYTVSAWMRAFNVQTAPGGWFEAWARDTSGVESDLKLAESMRVTGELDWTLESINFTIPDGYNGVYLKMGAQSGESGIVWYDGVSMYTGAGAVSQFTIVQNGMNALHYFSTDNQGNVEPTQTESPIKIDTVQPEDWEDFGWEIAGNNHTYNTWVTVNDVSSGIVPESAQYRWYDSGDCNCWSAWLPMLSVTQLSNGQPAARGYTGDVVLRTPATDMGNSSINTKPKVQFRINDVASSLATSPAYSLFGPWLQVTNSGDILAMGSIDGLGPVPYGNYNTQGLIISGGSAYSVASYYDWIVAPYSYSMPTGTTLADFFPRYNQMRAKALPLTGNKLPFVTGIYSYTGNYTIDQNSITTGFTSSQYSAVIIIEGNLHINRDYSLNDNTSVAFLVTGNIIFSENTSESAGFLIAAGDINTNGSSEDVNKTAGLVHRGGMIAGKHLIFGRDLGKNKNTDPAETIDFPVRYLVDPVFAGLFNQRDNNLKWQEVE